MDIAALSQTNAQQSLHAQAGTAILAKGLDAMAQQGAELMKLMATVPASAPPLAEGLGANFDTFA